MTATVHDHGSNPYIGRRATAHCFTCRISLTPNGPVDRETAKDAADEHNAEEHPS